MFQSVFCEWSDIEKWSRKHQQWHLYNRCPITPRLKNVFIGLPWWLSGKESAWMQETCVWSLFQEDPTCLGETKPVCHNYWVCALKPGSHNYCAHVSHYWSPGILEHMLHNKRNHHEKPTAPLLTTTREKPESSGDPAQPKPNK